MRVAVLGRTQILLASARALAAAGHEIPIVGTSKADPFYEANEDDFREFARQVGADFFLDPNVNRPEIVERLVRSGCGVAVSFNWVSMIGRPACEAFTHGILNVHPGDLPRYRGNACPNWAILNKETYVGLAVHNVNPDGLDDGPILVRGRFEMTPDTYIGEIYDWLYQEVPLLLMEAVTRLERGTAQFEEQSANPQDWLRCYPRRPSDSRIDWARPCDDIHRLIRASSHPLGGAYTSLEGERKVTIWRATPYEHQGAFLAAAGQVMFKEGRDPIIACGSGALRLEDISVEGLESCDEAKALIGRSLRNRLV